MAKENFLNFDTWRHFENLGVSYSAAVAIATRGQDGLGTGCHHFATPNSFAITFAAL